MIGINAEGYLKKDKIYNNPENMRLELPPLQLRKGVSLN